MVKLCVRELTSFADRIGANRVRPALNQFLMTILHLHKTQVTDAGLQHLNGLTKLTELGLTDLE